MKNAGKKNKKPYNRVWNIKIYVRTYKKKITLIFGF